MNLELARKDRIFTCPYCEEDIQVVVRDGEENMPIQDTNLICPNCKCRIVLHVVRTYVLWRGDN